MNYENKYIKYKKKYIIAKRNYQSGGMYYLRKFQFKIPKIPKIPTRYSELRTKLLNIYNNSLVNLKQIFQFKIKNYKLIINNVVYMIIFF